MRAVIEWIRPEEGGRSAVPSGTGPRPYATLVRFPGSSEPWPPAKAWSLVVEKAEGLNAFTWEAEVRFLEDDAPTELLISGRRFELYEGWKRVAVGELH